MAKKQGLFGTLGTLFRVAVVLLAGILVYAIWQNYADDADVVAEAPAVDAPVAEEAAAEAKEVVDAASGAATEQAEDVAEAVTEKVDEAREVAEETIAAVSDAAGENVADAAAAATALADTATEKAEETVAAATEMAGDAGAQAEETVAALAEDAEQAVGEVKDKAETAFNNLLKPSGDAASSMTTLKVPGDDTVYAMIETTLADDGAINVISQKTGDDTTLTLSRVTCAPLALGVMAAGATRDALETRAEPDMERLVLGTPEAALAAYACGAVK